MAKRTVLVSDLSGEAIEEGKGATVRISFQDQRRGNFELDARADEVEEWAKKGRKVARRGRRPRSEGG